MFTGIIQTIGEIAGSEARDGDRRLSIRCPELDLATVAIGDSIAVSGTCLTVVELQDDRFSADVSNESLDLTTLGQLEPGARVNLELALTPSSRLGGHLMTGHVDGLGRLLSRSPDGRSERFEFESPQPLAAFIAAKGSIALDGISLTVNTVHGNQFGVNLIPHTLERTTMGQLKPGGLVNLEIDILARYVARLHQVGELALNTGFAKDHGFE
jgi:riboflavin synthase